MFSLRLAKLLNFWLWPFADLFLSDRWDTMPVLLIFNPKIEHSFAKGMILLSICIGIGHVFETDNILNFVVFVIIFHCFL